MTNERPLIGTSEPAPLERVDWLRDLLKLPSNWQALEMLKKGVIPGRVKLGKLVRVDTATVLAFIAGGGTVAPKPAPTVPETSTKRRRLS